MMNLRFDFIFTYWIVGWYILYVAGRVSYNPLGILLLNLLAHVIMLMVMLYYSYSYILLFVVQIVLLNVLPLWYIWKNPYVEKDLYASIVVTLMYLTWVWIHQMNVISLYQSIFQKVANNHVLEPGMKLFYRFLLYVKPV
jgi:hypothetical protein